MQRDLVVKGRSLGGCADLTLLASIKPGFVDSLESVTYKTRIKRVLETLHGARAASHEHHAARLLSDAVERVGAIHSVRVAVLEPEDKVLLAVSFDGSWESYIRVLWNKVGTLLDLIFCGTVDYVSSHDHSFEQWLGWAQRVQVETGFFYGPPESTARDVLYQRRVERMRLRGAGGELNELRAVQPSAEEAARRLVRPRPEFEDEPRIGEVTAWRMRREQVRLGLRGLAALYRLTDLYRPSTPDGEVLRRAAIDLLLEFVQLRDSLAIREELEEAHATRFARQLDWLFPPGSGAAIVARPIPAPAEQQRPLDPAVRRDIQGGILRPYTKITHGLLLILELRSPAAVAALLDWLDAPAHRLSADADPHDGEPGRVFRNLALTPAGLRAAGIGEDALELFPEAFRQGMAARAGLLGDVRNNHPQRWRLPQRFAGLDRAPAAETIELDVVHAVLQLRCAAPGKDALELHEPGHPLRTEVAALCEVHPGLHLLAVQALMRRYAERAGQPVIVEHFGYQDGNGQPDVEPPVSPAIRNRVHVGEIVLGHDNAADFAPDLSDPTLPAATRERMHWLANGSFLVMRKYRQFVHRLETAVAHTAAEMRGRLGGAGDDFAESVYAKLMGRGRNGEPLVPHIGQLNNFVYDADPQGRQCPLHAHIRLAHPRAKQSGAERAPRLMRRSMSYGPAHARDQDDDHIDRGLVFMAYNASLSEQYEVVQRWLSGGNSTGSSSGHSCPIVGVPENGLPRHYPFEVRDAGGAEHVFRLTLEGATPLFEEPQVPVRLEWGLYLFAPSFSALRRLRAVAATAAGAEPVPWQLARGRRLLAALQRVAVREGAAAAVEAWKAAIEDPESIDRLDAASIWAAIRADHGGLLKTPYGTLVAQRELVAAVYLDPRARYSVRGQLERMRRSFGEISLGMDAGPEYEQQSAPINRAIGALTATPEGRQRVFETACAAATRKLDAIVAQAKDQAVRAEDTRFEVGFDAREIADEILADLCEAWFGLNDDPGRRFRRGGSDWAWQRGDPPPYPGHFTALSRYMFQPNPGPTAVELGQRYGQALREAMQRFVADHRARGTTPRAPGGSAAPIALATFTHPSHGSDDDFVARNMVGVLMGFNPTIIGALLNVLREWQRDGRFGALRAELAGRSDRASAQAVLAAAMAAAARMRPMPQIGWRTALQPHRLGPDGPGGVDVAVGDKIVLAMVSGTQQSLADGRDDQRLMFGGRREETPHPTHACPGYEAGIEAMLGGLAALLSRRESMRPSGPLGFVLEGASGYVAPPVPVAEPMLDLAAAMAGLAPLDAIPGLPVPLPAEQTVTLLAWGDSWLDARLLGAQDLKEWLKLMGHRLLLEREYCNFERWGTIERMAASAGVFCDSLVDEILSGRAPSVILLSGGGNDSKGSALFQLLRPAGSPDVLDGAAVERHIERLHGLYATVLRKIESTLAAHGLGTVPVVVHGYDYPIPKLRDGFSALYDRDWLKKPFKDRQYAIDGRVDGIPARAMRSLIQALNAMLAALPGEFEFVRYAELPETIESQWTDDPTDGWKDDLHPISNAFGLLAGKVNEVIQALISQPVE